MYVVISNPNSEEGSSGFLRDTHINLMGFLANRWFQLLFRFPSLVRLHKLSISVVIYFREIFPLGLPEQFSFITTFRQRKVMKQTWDIIRITDIQDRPQFAITINPRQETVDFSIMDFEGRLQHLIFKKARVSFY